MEACVDVVECRGLRSKCSQVYNCVGKDCVVESEVVRVTRMAVGWWQ